MPHFLKKASDLLVCPVSESETLRWNLLMNQHHYLGFDSLLGEQIKYVAILGLQYIASEDP